MFARNSQIVIGLFIVVALAVIGSLLLSNNVGPASVQSQDNWPTPPTPDFAGFATSYCCDSGTVVFETPSAEQIALWTEVAATQTANFQSVGFATDAPQGQILVPSGEWETYTDSNFGYSFEYPGNWFVENDGSATVLKNISPGVPPKYSVNFLSIWIGPGENMQNYGSLETYFSDPQRAVPSEWIISQTTETLANGNQVIQRKQKMAVGTGALFIFLTNGNQIYEIHVNEMNSPYIDVVNRLLESFVIPK